MIETTIADFETEATPRYESDPLNGDEDEIMSVVAAIQQQLEQQGSPTYVKAGQLPLDISVQSQGKWLSRLASIDATLPICVEKWSEGTSQPPTYCLTER